MIPIALDSVLVEPARIITISFPQLYPQINALFSDIRFPAESRSPTKFFVSPIFGREGELLDGQTQEPRREVRICSVDGSSNFSVEKCCGRLTNAFIMKETTTRAPVPFRPSDPDPVFATRRPPTQTETTTATTTARTSTTTSAFSTPRGLRDRPDPVGFSGNVWQHHELECESRALNRQT